MNFNFKLFFYFMNVLDVLFLLLQNAAFEIYIAIL